MPQPHPARQHHLTKERFTPEEQRAYRWLVREMRNSMRPVEDDIEGWLREAADGGDLSNITGIEGAIEERVGDYHADFEGVFQEAGRKGAEAGHKATIVRHQLDVGFDQAPERAIARVDDWAQIQAESTISTITSDSAGWIRGAQEDGLGIDEAASRMNEELFDNRLEGYVSERSARTAITGTSNMGAHDAHVEDQNVVAEKWLAAGDDRERSAHDIADGQVVLKGDTFTVGGEEMRFPGDPQASVGNIINCRCVVVPVFRDEAPQHILDQLPGDESGPAPSVQDVIDDPGLTGNREISRLEDALEQNNRLERADLADLDAGDAETLASRLDELDRQGQLDGVDSVRGGLSQETRAKFDTPPLGNARPNEGIVEFSERAFDEDRAARLGDSNYLAGDDVEHIIDHEIGHMRHAQQLDDDLNAELNGLVKRDSWPPTGTERQMLDEVSRRAGAHPNEFVAEVYAMKRRGEDLPDNLESLYESVYGPQPGQ